ncbi:myosin heavy chain, non-muscle-like [Montipora capricornis]|uniref:myosin heavy chain, non-muscle-like n=1 Tax=Montipora capricornis TaxID=246305 RepID=UPI0035F11493
MESDEELPDQREEYLSEFPPDDVTLHLENDLVQLGLGSDIYDETTYKELASERDDLRQRYERERRERERLEMKFQEEYDQKVYFEGKLSGLSRNISSYEDDLQALRLENGHLKSQFEQIRSALQTSIGAGSAGLARARFLGHRDVIGVNLISDTLSVPGNSEIYKQEVSLLAQENVLFKQIIEFIDNLEQSKAVLEERVSAHAQSNERQTLLEHDDVQRLEREKSGLEERVRDLERALGEQEKLIDEIQNKAEENLRVYKRERKVLENELHSQSSALNDYEMQISLMKQSHDTQIQAMEDRLETEITTSKEFQEQNKEILRNIRRLEEERQELLLRIEEAYQAENEVVENRVSRDMMELQRALEDEVQTKTELSVEIERLISELVESEKIRKEMEARFLQEGQKLQIPFDTERKVVSLNLNGTPINQVVRQTDSPQHTYPGSQGLPSETQMLKKEVDWKMKLTEEVRKRETLEEENKKLLYQINDLLEKNATERVIPKTSVDETINSPVGKTPYSWNAKRVKNLETEIVEIREECRILEKDAKKKKELETKNAELSEEIEDLTAKKDEAVRKQKELMRELDDSLSSVKQNEDKNRRLIEEADTLSGKIRQMENNFRNEKEDLIRTYSKNKSLEISELLTEKEAIEQKYNEQVKTNRSLEAEMDSSKKRIHDLEKQNECLQKMQGEITNRFTEDLNYERGRSATMNDELEKRLVVFRNHTEQLEAALCENKKMYDEEVRKLEEEKQRIRNELLTDKETYRKRFEEEKRSMESRINEVETKLRQQNSIGSEPVATTSYFGKNESFGNGTVSQPGRSVSTETISSDFKRQVDILGSMNKELQETPLNTEREHLREIDALELDNKKVKSTIEEDFRRKMDPNGKGVGVNEESSKGKATFSKAEVSDQRPFSDKSAPEHMEYLVRDYKEQMDDLKGQIKVQMEAFENEKQDLRRQLQEERNSTLRSKMNESSLLHITIQKRTDEVKILRQEKVNLLNRLKKEKGYNKKRETEFSEKVSKIREECERLRCEKNEAQKSVIDQRRKLAATEDRIQSMEEKHQMEIHQLEIKFKNKKTKLEQTIVTTESELKEGLQMEYRALLNKEREKYEDTMNDLRKEIASLQEQRRKIQTKLSSQTSRTSYQFITKKNWLNVQSFHKSPSNAYSRPFNGIKQVEDKLRDLEREVETLKREKTEIKVNYRQEKIQLQAEFDQQIVGLEEKYRRQIEGLKRRLHEATMQAQPSMLVSKKMVSVSYL